MMNAQSFRSNEEKLLEWPSMLTKFFTSSLALFLGFEFFARTSVGTPGIRCNFSLYRQQPYADCQAIICTSDQNPSRYSPPKVNVPAKLAFYSSAEEKRCHISPGLSQWSQSNCSIVASADGHLLSLKPHGHAEPYLYLFRL